MRYLRFLLFILILGPVSQSASGQELPGVSAAPPASILGPTLVTRRQRVTEPANEPSNVTGLTFKEVIYSSCAGKPAAECADDEAKIKVTTVAEDKENDILTYQYTVSVGRIIGQGASILWDLSGVVPGKYSITVGSDDGCGVCGRTMTKEVEIRAAPDVEQISLSKSEINSWCPGAESFRRSSCKKEQMIVDVTTTAKNIHDGLTYYYSVTGGKIVGEGPNVKWDLRDTFPGWYTISAGVGKDEVILGKIATEKVTEKECQHCDPACACPVIRVSGPAGPVKPGDTIVFHSSVEPADETFNYVGYHNERISYKWSVSDGTILNNPTSSTIMVKIPADFKEIEFSATFTLLTGAKRSCSCVVEWVVAVPVKAETQPPK